MKFLITFISILISTAFLNAQELLIQQESFFENYFKPGSDIEKMFSDSFLEKISLNEIIKIKDDFNDNYGNYTGIIQIGGRLTGVEFEKCTIPVRISFDDSGFVKSLWFGVPTFKFDTEEDIRKGFDKLRSNLSICIRKNRETIYAININQPMAVGSTFKLWVLSALLKKIKNNEIKWEDSIEIKNRLKSLPTGILQNSPEGYKISIRKAVNLMISISDNTATDHLINLIGKKSIEMNAPKTMMPFYSTKELFVLKLGKDSAFIRKYEGSDLVTKRKYLEEIDTFNVSNLDISLFANPRFIEIEYYVSTEELCKKIESLEGEEALSINGGLLKKNDWYYIAFKGGSEPGVMNLTYLIQKTKDSPKFTLSATINNPATNEEVNDFMILISRFIDLLSKSDEN